MATNKNVVAKILGWIFMHLIESFVLIKYPTPKQSTP